MSAWRGSADHLSRCSAVPAAAWGEDLDCVTARELDGHLVQQRDPLGLVATGPQPVLAGRTGAAALEAPGPALTTFRDQRQRRRLEDLDDPLDPVTAGRVSHPAAPPPQPVPSTRTG